MYWRIDKIDQVCKAIAKMRAGGCCEMCGNPVGEGHHIIFGADKGDWTAFCEPDFYAWLCADCHKYRPEAPHVDNDTFLAVYLAKIMSSQAQAIMARLEAPKNYHIPRPDWKEIMAELQDRYDEAEQTGWMDAEIELPYGQGCRNWSIAS